MICDPWRDKLDAYVDAAQNPEGACASAGLEEHLRVCPACTAEVLQRMQLKGVVRAAAAMRYQSPAEFRLRVEKSIRVKRRLFPVRRWVPILAAAAVAIAAVALSFQVWKHYSAREHALAQLVDVHVATVASANPVDVVSTDRHTVKPWFQGKLPFTFNLPEFDNTPYKLIGGKIVYLDDQPGAQLLFALRKHELSVFLVQDRPGAPLAGTIDARKNGFNITSWSQDKLHYTIVSDAGANEEGGLADLLKSTARQE